MRLTIPVRMAFLLATFIACGSAAADIRPNQPNTEE